MKYLKFFIFIFLFFTKACVDLVSDTFPEIEPVPVVNSIMVKDSLIKVFVSERVSIDTTDIPLINDAQVSLYKDGEFLEYLPYKGSGFYLSHYRAIENCNYECVVEIPGFDAAYCEDSIPSGVSVGIRDHTNKAGITDDGAYHPSITFSFKDDSSTRDYYEVLILEKFKANRYYSHNAFNSSYNFLLNEGFEPYESPTLLFSDEYINEDLNSLTLNYGMGGNISCVSGFCRQTIREHTIVLQVRKVTYDYYKYVKDFYHYETGRYGELVEGVVPPFQMYCNVTNGSGIFAAYSSAIDSIHIDAEEIPF